MVKLYKTQRGLSRRKKERKKYEEKTDMGSYRNHCTGNWIPNVDEWHLQQFNQTKDAENASFFRIMQESTIKFQKDINRGGDKYR